MQLSKELLLNKGWKLKPRYSAMTGSPISMGMYWYDNDDRLVCHEDGYIIEILRKLEETPDVKP